MSATPSIYLAIKQLRDLLSRKEKWRCLGIAGFSLIISALEIITASVIVLFAATLTNPETGMHYIHKLGIHAELSPARAILAIAIACGVFYLLKNILSAIEIYYQNFAIQHMNYQYKTSLLKKYADMDYALYLTRNSSYGMSVIAGDVEQMFSQGLLALANIFSEFFVFISLVAMVIYMNPSLAGMLFSLALVITFFLYKYVLPSFYRWGKKMQDASMESVQKLMQFFHGFKEIIIFEKKEAFINAYHQSSKQKAVTQAIHTATNSLPRVIIEILFVGLFICAISYLCLKHNHPEQMLAVLGGYLYLGFRVMPGLNRIINQTTIFKSIIPHIERLHKEHSLNLGSSQVKYEPNFRFNSAINVKSLSYKYLNTDKYALDKITFTINKGDCLGIVGETGSGKSTLVDLLLGLLKPTQGSILIDDKFPVNCKQWHDCVGYVPQSIYLNDDTIEANIAFGEEIINQEKLKKAIQVAQLQKLISSLPLGTKTLVGERGVRLSGGERQRIAIARALYREPSVIFFDEATSALDSKTEANLMETINLISKNYTVIMIAHRISTLSNCNKILKIHNGKIESKTLEDVMSNS